jgi:hypothetical protein
MSDKTNHGHRQAGDRRSIRTTLTAQGGELVAEVTRRRRAELDRLLKVLPRLEPDPARRTRIRSVNNFDPNGPWWHRPGYRASRSAGVGRTTLIALLFGRYSAPQRRGPAGPGTPAGDSSAVTKARESWGDRTRRLRLAVFAAHGVGTAAGAAAWPVPAHRDRRRGGPAGPHAGGAGLGQHRPVGVCGDVATPAGSPRLGHDQLPDPRVQRPC